MGVDCTLLPIDFENADGTWGYSHVTLHLDRNYDVWDMLRALPDAGAPPKDFTSYVGGRVPDGAKQGEPCYGQTEETPYGAPVRCVFAADIGALREKLADYKLPWTKAAIVFCEALPPKTRVALWWH
jgi:hypothetical protein